MSSYGIQQADICAVIGVTPKTLRKHYRKELDTASAVANTQVADRLFKKAIEGCTTSMIFWLKTRARWNETVQQQMLDEDGNPTNNSLKVEFVN